jgi:hypothetical protein
LNDLFAKRTRNKQTDGSDYDTDDHGESKAKQQAAMQASRGGWAAAVPLIN